MGYVKCGCCAVIWYVMKHCGRPAIVEHHYSSRPLVGTSGGDLPSEQTKTFIVPVFGGDDQDAPLAVRVICPPPYDGIRDGVRWRCANNRRWRGVGMFFDYPNDDAKEQKAKTKGGDGLH